MKRTVLNSNHKQREAKMVEFGGWEMPVRYDGILNEHEHTRKVASLFDICHMGEFILSGETAAEDLNRILAQNIATLQTAQCRYGYMLNENGGVLDDMICYRLEDERYMVVVNAATADKDKAWIKGHLSAATDFEDISDQTGKIDLQGPRSKQLLGEALGIDVPELKFFRSKLITVDGIDVLLSRSGYTGEWGYELYLPAEQTEYLWDRLLQHEAIKPAGLGARDTLRLEVGLPLYGNDLSEERTPIAATRGMFIGKNKDFIGRSAVERDQEEGCKQYLTALELNGRRAARPHDKVYLGDREVGEVTSGSLAPSLGVAIALAYVDADILESGLRLEIEVRRKRLKAGIVDLPFYKNGTVR